MTRTATEDSGIPGTVPRRGGALREFIQEQERQRMELEKLIAPLE